MNEHTQKLLDKSLDVLEAAEALLKMGVPKLPMINCPVIVREIASPYRARNDMTKI